MPTTLFDTLKVGSLSVPSRIFMVTRPRCDYFLTLFGQQKGDVLTPARETLKGPALLVNMGFEIDEAKEGVAAGSFDAVAFGTKFLANPDLPARIAAGAALNDPKADLFYTGKVGDLTYTGPEGYTDYPPLTPN
jgi:N-ethylmaleimide reductase